MNRRSVAFVFAIVFVALGAWTLTGLVGAGKGHAAIYEASRLLCTAGASIAVYGFNIVADHTSAKFN